MRRAAVRLFAAAVLLCSGPAVSAQEKIENWAAPLLWSPPAKSLEKEDANSGFAPEAVEAVPTPPLHFVGLTPCRLADTRGNGFTGQYGPPSLVAGVPRNFVLTGQCGISATAQAVSLNVTVTNTQGPGHIVIYPQGGAQPTVSTLNYVAGQTIANAAVVPLGVGGGITVIAGVSGTDLILDTNGDYRGGVVTALNGLSGAVTLAGSSTVTVTPTGNTLTLAATGGPGGLLPSGFPSGRTLRSSGTGWVASNSVYDDGTDIELAGILRLPVSARIYSGASRILHNTGSDVFTENTFVGRGAGNETTPGSGNTGVGYVALTLAGAGSANNVAVGQFALRNLDTGSGNIAIGGNAGSAIVTGSNNIYIGNQGPGNESGQIRIGDAALQNGTVIAGIYGGAISGLGVVINAGGRLGTTPSSRRYKSEIHDIGAESDGLMSLRPVAFKYTPEVDPTGTRRFGLIAEEVAEIYPDLVVNDERGRPRTVRYELVNTLLLKEVQNQHGKLEAQATTIDTQRKTIDRQQAEIDELRSRLSKIEDRFAGELRP
jgi:hypothetical protein